MIGVIISTFIITLITIAIVVYIIYIKYFDFMRNMDVAMLLHKVESGGFKNHPLDKYLSTMTNLISLYAVSCLDDSGRLRYVNTKFEKMSGYEKSELLGKHFSVIFPEMKDEEFWMLMMADLSDGKMWHGSFPGEKKDGGILWADTFIVPLSMLMGDDSGYLNLSTDITEIKKRQELLETEVLNRDRKLSEAKDMLVASEKMASLGVMSAGIAHEINNPISYIKSNVALLKDSFDILCEIASRYLNNKVNIPDQLDVPDEEIKYLTKDIPILIKESEEGIERVCKIVSDLRTFSHESNFTITKVSIINCIETALRLSQPETKYGIDITKIYGADSHVINGNEQKLTQVFLNLFINAAQAMNGKGNIRIVTKTLNGIVYITVEDDGPGIPLHFVNKIFNPFFTTKPVGKGTGLGLAISKEIIESHNGEIFVNTEYDKGSQFVLSLPSAVS